LKIRQDNYWRLEISDVEGESFEINAFKDVLRSTIVFENTPCPFRTEKAERVYEEQAPLPVFKRRLTISTPTWNLPKATIEEELTQSPFEITSGIHFDDVKTKYQQVDDEHRKEAHNSPNESQTSSIGSSFRDSMSSRGSFSSKNTSVSGRSTGLRRKNIPEYLPGQRPTTRTRTPSIVSFFDNFASETPLPQSPLRKPFIDGLMSSVPDSPLLSPHQTLFEASDNEKEKARIEDTFANEHKAEDDLKSLCNVSVTKPPSSSPRAINITRSVTAPTITTPLSPTRLQDKAPPPHSFTFADIATGRIKNDQRPSAIPRSSGIFVSKRVQCGPVSTMNVTEESHDSGSIDGEDWSRPVTPSTPSLSSAGSDSTMSDWTCLSTPGSSNSFVAPTMDLKTKSTKDRSQSYTSSYNDRIAAVAARSHRHSTRRRARTLDTPRDEMNGSVSLASIAQRTTSLILNKTIDIAVVKPTSYFASILCSMASKIARGTTVYSYYWAAQDSPEFVDMAAMENHIDEFEDDFGVSLVGLRRDKPEYARRSRSSSLIQDFLLERST